MRCVYIVDQDAFILTHSKIFTSGCEIIQFNNNYENNYDCSDLKGIKIQSNFF